VQSRLQPFPSYFQNEFVGDRSMAVTARHETPALRAPISHQLERYGAGRESKASFQTHGCITGHGGRQACPGISHRATDLRIPRRPIAEHQRERGMSVDRGRMCFLEIGALNAVAEKKKIVNGAARFTLFQMVAKRNHSASGRLDYLISLRMLGFSLSRHLITHFDP